MAISALLGPLLRCALASLMLVGTTAFAGTILVWGDSLSAGYGLQTQQAWPALLAQRISETRLPHKVVNASISGETTAGGRNRLPAALQSYKPSVVIIELGANDGLRGLPASAMAANLQAMIDASRQAGAKVLLVGMRMPPNYGPDYTSRFENAFRDLAKANKTRLVPFMMEGFADKRNYFQQDGIHPVADAQPFILDTIWQELKPLLR
jgi:acyl-CoA thioesterase-1